jgi:hypothetical protein
MLFLVSALGLMIAVLLSTGFMGRMQENGVRTEASAIAGQMLIYHAAAERACSGACPQGVIAPTLVRDQLPSFRQGASQGIFTDGRLSSFAVKGNASGNFVVTYLNDTTVNVREQWGNVRGEASDTRSQDSGIWSSYMNRSTSTVLMRDDWVWTADDGEKQVLKDITISIPGSIAASIPDNAPVLVSRM